MPGKPCWGLGGRILFPELLMASPRTSRLTPLSYSFHLKRNWQHKAKPVIITLLIALSRDSDNQYLSFLAHLSGLPGDGEGEDMGTLGSHSEQTPSPVYFQVRWLPSFSFAKPFLFLHLKETQHDCCNFFSCKLQIFRVPVKGMKEKQMFSLLLTPSNTTLENRVFSSLLKKYFKEINFCWMQTRTE